MLTTALILAALLIAAYMALKRLGPLLAEHRATEAEGGQMYKWRPSGTYAIGVVGESHYVEALTSILGSKREVEATAVLIPYHHPKDSNAVRVEIRGQVVGHISRDDAPVFRALLAKKHKALAASCCKAVVGGNVPRPDGSKGPIGVSLDIADLE